MLFQCMADAYTSTRQNTIRALHNAFASLCGLVINNPISIMADKVFCTTTHPCALSPTPLVPVLAMQLDIPSVSSSGKTALLSVAVS